MTEIQMKKCIFLSMNLIIVSCASLWCGKEVKVSKLFSIFQQPRAGGVSCHRVGPKVMELHSALTLLYTCDTN